jgi:hypothetical protein
MDLTLVSNAIRKLAGSVLVFPALFFRATEPDPIHQNDELDKIPDLP